MELVSIVIPVYNAECYISDTNENILQQTYKNYEIILVDDKSTDNSLEIIRKYTCDNIVVIELSENKGPAIARNIGVKAAKGRYICFQDADDLWNKQKLEKQIKFMKENDCAFSYTAFQYANEFGEKKNRILRVPFILTYKQALKYCRILTISTMFDLRKITKEEIEMPNIKCEDMATWWKILRKGYIAYGLNESLVYYRRTANTLTSNKLVSSINRWKLYRKYENLSVLKSLYYFLHYSCQGILKRL